MECTTAFMPQLIDTFDLKLDGQSISSYPLKLTSGLRHQFYQKFITETNMISNPFSSGPLNYSDYIAFNFILPENLKRKNITQGDLCVTIKFTAPLPDSLQLIIYNIDQKCITFDEFLNMEIIDVHGNAVDDDEEG